MGWFRQSKTSVKPDYTGLQLQTSVSTLPVPIIWGQNKAAANVIWYANFQSQGQGGGGGKGGGGGPTSYTYSADLILALCEGPISSIGIIWKDQSIYTLAGLGLTLFNGTTPQATWGYLAAGYPSQALAYQGVAYVGGSSYSLGSTASISNHNFEIIGRLAGTGVNGIDADPAQVIYDFLTNAQYGVGFSAASISGPSLFGSGGDASLQSYCAALGIAFSPILTNVEQGSTILSRWLQLLNCGAVWSGGLLKFIPYGDTPIASGGLRKTKNQVVLPSPSVGSPYVVVCGASAFSADGGVVYTATGVPLTYVGAGPPGFAGQYGISPAGTYLFALTDSGKSVQISYTYKTGVSYVPNLTPIYNLTDVDFIDEKGNKDPVQAARLDPFSLPTIQRIECVSRSNQYAMTPIEARDQSQIELYGPRVGSQIQAHEICDEINVGPLVAQTILQRALYVRTHFTFKLSWEYCLLDPMDIVTITDANLGLSNVPVRITSIEEDDNGQLTVTAEELTVGVSTPVLYPNAGASGFQLNQGAAADPVNAPLIYEPPSAATGGAAQVWVGASGGLGGVADPNWGGAYVWISLDNISYSNIATLSQPLRQGFLTAALAAASGWDTTHTLSVTLAESGGALSGTSIAAAQSGATLCLVDSELLAYQSATLTGANAYNLANLQRGISTTAPASHGSGAPFARIDNAVVKYSLPANYVGQTLYFKFQSFNVFGAGLQNLATCAVYTYVPTGAASPHPIMAALQTGAPDNLGTAAPVTVSDNFGGAEAATSAWTLGASI